METISVYEISGIIITFVGALISFFKSNAEHKTVNTLAVSLLGVVITMLVSIRFALLPDINKALTVAVELNNNPVTSRIVPNMIKVEDILKKNDNELMNYILQTRLNSLETDLTNAINQEFVVRDAEMPEFALRMMATSSMDIYATSFVLVDEWWNTPWGKKYEATNFDAIKRGVNIHRIFIFKNKEAFEKTKKHLSDQNKGKIDVRYVFEKDLPSQFKSDIIVIDNKLGGKLELTNEHNLQNATFFKNKNKIDELSRTYKSIEAQSEKVNF